MTDADALKTMKHLATLAGVLHGVMVSLVSAIRATPRGIFYTCNPISVDSAAVSNCICRLSALASNEAGRIVSRWELGVTEEGDLLMWSDTVEIIVGQSGGTTAPLQASHNLPHPREWIDIRVRGPPVRWIGITEKGCGAHPFALGRDSLFKYHAGGILVSIRGTPGYCDRAIIQAICASFPEALVFAFFDADVTGIVSYMTLKFGTGATNNYPEFEPLRLGSRIKNCTPIPQPDRGRPLTSSERATISKLQTQVPESDPDHTYLTTFLQVGRSAVMQTAGKTSHWARDLLPALRETVSTATVSSSLQNVLPGNAERDEHFPTFEEGEVMIDDLADVRDFWHDAWKTAKAKPGTRPKAFEITSRWRVHKRRRSHAE